MARKTRTFARASGEGKRAAKAAATRTSNPSRLGSAAYRDWIKSHGDAIAAEVILQGAKGERMEWERQAAFRRVARSGEPNFKFPPHPFSPFSFLLVYPFSVFSSFGYLWMYLLLNLCTSQAPCHACRALEANRVLAFRGRREIRSSPPTNSTYSIAPYCSVFLFASSQPWLHPSSTPPSSRPANFLISIRSLGFCQLRFQRSTRP